MKTDASGGILRYSLDSDEQALSLGFKASRDAIEGVLALAMEWAGRLRAAQDDTAALRLVLEELLTNILFHSLGETPSPARPSPAAEPLDGQDYVYLQLEFLPSSNGPVAPEPASPAPSPAGAVRLEIKDRGGPFNPFAEQHPAFSRPSGSPGGRGLTLVRLFSTQHSYLRKDGRNEISLRIPLGGASAGSAPAGKSPAVDLRGPDAAAQGPSLAQQFLRAWRQKALPRLTAIFTVSIFIICCLGIGVYHAAIVESREDNAEARALQSMITQEEVSWSFLKRVEAGLLALSSRLSSLPRADLLLSDSEAVLRLVRERNLLGPFRAAVPVAGFVLGQRGRAGVWFFQKSGTDVVKEWAPSVFDAFAPIPGQSPQWQGPLRKASVRDMGRHAAMIFSLPAGEHHWMGIVLTMPWIDNTLRALSGFERAAPMLLNAQGEYVIYPPGRSSADGPQGLDQETASERGNEPPALPRVLLGGRAGLEQMDASLLRLWPLPWEGPSSLLAYPMKLPGWRLAMIVPNSELGIAPRGFSPAPLLTAFGCALLVGLVTALTARRVLTPLRQLADSLERLARGDLDTPFPVPRDPDETGLMLQNFERTRVILKTSLQSLVQGAAMQERIRHELALARSIQEDMLPTAFPAFPGIDVAAGIDMAFEVCGDLYDCFSLDPASEPPARLACVVGDVCGKGIPAALVMSGVISLARAFLLQGLSPARTLERLNDAILRRDLSSMFVTLLIGVCDSSDRSFTWTSAGHPAPILGPDPAARGPANATALPWPNELVLGVRPGVRYSAQRLFLRPGQALLLRTDGADEAMGLPPLGGAGRIPLYGEERLVSSFGLACEAASTQTAANGPTPATPAAGILEYLRKDLARHTGGRPPHDDITLMVIRRVPDAGVHRSTLKQIT